jgi:hypothetical protein
MNKGDRIEHFVETLHLEDAAGHSPFYLGYFRCFNAGEYYEAHDVLEHLWLKDRGNRFYKGLIQIAGAFVHLRKQALRPDHPKDGKRLRPAAKLFALGVANVGPYQPVHEDLDIVNVLALCERYTTPLAASNYTVNPWSQETRPTLSLIERG